MKKYVYQVIAPDKNLSVSQSNISSNDIDMDKFENIVKQIQKKSEHNSSENINNIFN